MPRLIYMRKPSPVNKVYLMRYLCHLKMGEGVSIDDHINEFKEVVSKLNSVEIHFDDHAHTLILLSSLRDSWNTTVTDISNSSRLRSLSYDEVQDLI